MVYILIYMLLFHLFSHILLALFHSHKFKKTTLNDFYAILNLCGYFQDTLRYTITGGDFIEKFYLFPFSGEFILIGNLETENRATYDVSRKYQGICILIVKGEGHVFEILCTVS